MAILLGIFARITNRVWRLTKVAMKLLPEPVIKPPLPVARPGMIFDFCGSVSDQDFVIELAQASAFERRMARPENGEWTVLPVDAPVMPSSVRRVSG